MTRDLGDPLEVGVAVEHSESLRLRGCRDEEIRDRQSVALVSGAPWQRCQRHFLQNALEKVPARLEEELHEALRAIWDDSEDVAEAREGLRALDEAATLTPVA